MICILLADGFEEAEALIPCDLLRRAGFEVSLCGLSGKHVKGSHGVCVEADIDVKDIVLETVEAVILPGGMPGASNIDACPHTDEILNYAYRNGLVMGAICAAPFILGKRGFLRGRTATCCPSFERYLEGAELRSVNVVCNGNIITARAAGAAFDFALKIIEKLKDHNTADDIRRGIFYGEY